MLMSAGGPAGALFGMFVGSRLSRQKSIVCMSAIAAILGSVYPFMYQPVLVVLVGFGLVSAVYALVALCFGLYVPELFPTDIRMRGAGVCNTLGRMMTIVTPYFVVGLYGGYGIVGVVSLMVFLLILQMAAILVFGIDTRGRSLEALAESDLNVPSGRVQWRKA